MANLSYSSGALSSLTLFHQKKRIIYVEGPDDILFWELIMSQLGLSDYLIKPAGGVEEIKKYTNSIIDNSADIIVARDRDYEDFEGTIHDNHKVIYTYGHSIENSLQCTRMLSKVTANYLRTINSFEIETRTWQNTFKETVKDLIMLEIANAMSKKKREITGKTCVKLLVNSKSHLLCVNKTKKYYEGLSLNFADNQIDSASALLSNINKNIIWLVRGHFLTAASLNFIKYIVRRERGSDFSMDHYSFYTMLISALNIDLLEDDDRDYLNMQVVRLLAA